MKLNVKRTSLFLLCALCIGLFVGEWITVIFTGASFTWYGLMINLLELFVATSIITYFENYLEGE